MTWPLVRLGDVCEIVSGATPSTSVSEYWDGEHYWATPKDLSDLRETYIEKTSRRITKRGLDSCAAAVLPINSVLFSSRAPIGLVAINRVPMATNQGFKSFVPRHSVLDSKFLFHLLKYSRPRIEAMGVGATFKEVSKSIVEKIQIPLPPLAEQQRIAALLDTADNLLRLRETAIEKLDQLAESVFIEMFGNDKPNNKNWSRTKLGSLCDIEWGNTSITKASYIDDGIPAFSASGQDGFLAEAEHDGRGIVLSAIGARCGKCFKASGKWTAIKNTITIKPKSDRINIDFLFQILNDEKSWDVRGAGQPFITLSTSRSREIIVPPIQLQNKFAALVNEMEHRRTDFEVSKQHLLALRISLQNESFAVN